MFLFACFFCLTSLIAYFLWSLLTEVLIISNGLFLSVRGIKDVRLLAKNSELVKSLELPLCRVLKLIEALNSLDKGRQKAEF